MKYRIKVFGNPIQGYIFMPQYRYRFVPFWFGFSVGAWSESFYNEQDAKDFIAQHIKDRQASKLNKIKIITYK